MAIKRGDDGRWPLPFDGQFIHSVARMADTAVRLDVSNNEHQELRIACAYRLVFADDRIADGDPEHLDDVPPLLALAGRTIRRANFSGDLRVAFDDGSILTVPPHPDYEAWEVAAADGLLVVAMPGGGEPAIWSSPSFSPPDPPATVDGPMLRHPQLVLDGADVDSEADLHRSLANLLGFLGSSE